MRRVVGVAAHGGVATCLGSQLVAAQRNRHARRTDRGVTAANDFATNLIEPIVPAAEQGRGALVGVGCRGQGAEAGCRLGLTGTRSAIGRFAI